MRLDKILILFWPGLKVITADANSYDGSIMEKVKTIEALIEDEKKTVFSIVDAFTGKKKLKDRLLVCC